MTSLLFHNTKLCKEDELRVDVVPSEKIFYGAYPYKIMFVGNRVNYDPVDHYELSLFLTKEKLYHRELWTYECRYMYFLRYEDVELLCNFFSDRIIRVEGPVSQKHLKLLLAGPQNLLIKTTYFYNKFDTRLELVGSANKDGILNFVSENFDDYKWARCGVDWHFNYLYCHKTELDQVFGFLKIAYSSFLRSYSHTEVILHSDL